MFNLARIAGPAVAGLVISAAGTPVAFLINAASYGAVLISLKLMRPSELHAVERLPRARGQLREAMSYVKKRPGLWMPMVLIFFVSTFGMNFQVTNALMSRGVFHTGAGAFGLASAVFAAGALGGALLAARRGRPTMALLLGTSLAFGVLEVITGLMPDFWSFLILLVPTGLALLTLTTAANSATQLGTTADMRGRVMGLYLLVFLGGTPLGSPLAGWIAEAFGPRLERAAHRHPGLSLSFGAGGAFPAPGRARVLWTGIHGDLAALGALARSVAAGARRAGAPPPDESRRFRPHLTLARCREPADVGRLVEALADYAGAPWTAAEIHLIRSHLGAVGGRPRYEAAGTWPLRVSPDPGRRVPPPGSPPRSLGARGPTAAR